MECARTEFRSEWASGDKLTLTPHDFTIKICDRTHWVATNGNVTDEAWNKYIEDQKSETPDDNFRVV